MTYSFKKVLKDPYRLGASSLFLFIACWFYPVNSFLARAILIAVFTLFWFSPYIAGVRNKKLMIGHIIFTVTLFSLPSLLIDKKSVGHLQSLYVKNLKSFEGTAYYWGGENLIGIDCSGLPRKSMMNACFFTGHFSKAMELWWYDSSARALKESYRSYTSKVATFGSLRDVDYSLLTAGDMAVTVSGVHVIVYLGEGKWVHADPDQARVVVEGPKLTKSTWFDVKVEVVRWNHLTN